MLHLAWPLCCHSHCTDGPVHWDSMSHESNARQPLVSHENPLPGVHANVVGHSVQSVGAAAQVIPPDAASVVAVSVMSANTNLPSTWDTKERSVSSCAGSTTHFAMLTGRTAGALWVLSSTKLDNCPRNATRRPVPS